MTVESGIAGDARKDVAAGLSRLLADTYILYLKTQGYHWNVEGPMFLSLHEMFEAQYVELRPAIDEIAERIRTLGPPAPASFAQFGEMAVVKEDQGTSDAMEMVRELAEGHEIVVATAREVLARAEAAGDVATEDLVTVRIQAHEKTAWMLRATLA